MYTVDELNELPKNAVMVIINQDGTKTVYEAGDELPSQAEE